MFFGATLAEIFDGDPFASVKTVEKAGENSTNISPESRERIPKPALSTDLAIVSCRFDDVEETSCVQQRVIDIPVVLKIVGVQDRSDPHRSVLQVRSRLSFELDHFFEIELEIVGTIVFKSLKITAETPIFSRNLGFSLQSGFFSSMV
jgi:hypothetical protein